MKHTQFLLDLAATLKRVQRASHRKVRAQAKRDLNEVRRGWRVASGKSKRSFRSRVSQTPDGLRVTVSNTAKKWKGRGRPMDYYASHINQGKDWEDARDTMRDGVDSVAQDTADAVTKGLAR